MDSLEKRVLRCRGEEGRVCRILPGNSESCRVRITPQVWDGDAVGHGALVCSSGRTAGAQSVCVPGSVWAPLLSPEHSCLLPREQDPPKEP